MKAHTKGTTHNTIMEKSLLLVPLLCLPVELSNENAVQTKHKTTIQLTYGSIGHPNWLLGGPAWGTEPEQLSVVQIYWNSSRINIGLI